MRMGNEQDEHCNYLVAPWGNVEFFTEDGGDNSFDITQDFVIGGVVAGIKVPTVYWPSEHIAQFCWIR